jgi:hypothetical protein
VAAMIRQCRKALARTTTIDSVPVMVLILERKGQATDPIVSKVDHRLIASPVSELLSERISPELRYLHRSRSATSLPSGRCAPYHGFIVCSLLSHSFVGIPNIRWRRLSLWL